MGSLFIKDKQFYTMAAAVAIPIALQGLITTGVNMMDTLMVGMVGEQQLSAVSLANQFIHIFQILCMGLGFGASVLISRYYGMQEYTSLRRSIAIMLRLCLSIATLFCVLTAVAPTWIMEIYTSEQGIISHGIAYLRYSAATYYLLGLSMTCTIVLRSVGQVKLPLFTSIAAFFINVGANYLFIFGKWGAPEMGAAGAAIGTLIARAFETAVICGYLFFFETQIGFRIRDFFRPVGALLKEYIRVSIPVLISDGILALGNNSVAMIIGRIGGAFVAANAVTTVAQQLSTVFIQGFSQAGAIITGQTLGEGKRERALQQGYAFLGIGFLFGLLAGGAILLGRGPLLSLYELSAETKEIAMQLMLSISITTVFQATNSMMTKGVLRGGGDTKVLMLADNIFLWAASVPLGILSGLVLHLPAFWIYFSLKIDNVLKAVWCVIRLRSGKWIKRIKSFE